MNPIPAKQLLAIVEKIRVFKGFRLNEAERLLKVSKYKTYAADEEVYRVDTPSREMLILLQGRLKVLSRAGMVLAEILPGTCCGEMGLFTGRVRTATIVAATKSAGFAIAKYDLDDILKADPEMRIKVLENVVELLCERLAEADVYIDNYIGKYGKPRSESESPREES